MSTSELIRLCEGMNEDDWQALQLSRRERRSSAQKGTSAIQRMYTQGDDDASPSSLLSASPSTMVLTPPLVSSTARTSFSAWHSDNESELSSVPDELSDNLSEYSEPEPPKKRRKVNKTAATNRTGAASTDQHQEQGRLLVSLKVNYDRLQQSNHSTPLYDPDDSPQQPSLLPTISEVLTEQPRQEDSAQNSPSVTKTQLLQHHNQLNGGVAADSTTVEAFSFVEASTPLTPPPSTKRKRAGRSGSGSPALQPRTPGIKDSFPRKDSVHASDPISEGLQPLVEVSRQLMALSSCPIKDKPLPTGLPEVWADGRQALCESLPYYRAYQSAGYCTGGFAMSFMFDQEGSPRDYMDSEVVIARSGGGLSRDKSTGKMARQADQAEGSQVRSVRNSMEQFNPIVILSGNRNLQCPSKMPRVYNVLDWFKPTHIWFEKANGMVNIRYRFEKLDREKPSWWASSGGPEPTRIGDQQPPHVQDCTNCQQPSQQIYLQGWMCLQPACPQFWQLDSGREPREEDLLYDPRFLKQYTPWPHSSAPQPLRPEPLSPGPTPRLGADVSWAAAKGIVCNKCGRCNSREAWECWECGNPDCDFTYSLPHISIPPNALHDAYNPLSSGYAPSKDWFSSIIPLRVEFAHHYRIQHYSIPGIDGFIAHFIANKTVNEEAGGPDDMWTELQTADLGLRRRPLGCSTLQGPMLTQHFCVNYGMPYKFIAATASRPFDTAASAINTTRSRLNWAARHCVGSENHDQKAEFNELLALGYFERQKIDYHDDGEYGLGPTIATLSLGAPASMKIRQKAKHHNGITKSGAYVNKPPAPGCFKYGERKAAHEHLEALKDDSEAFKARLRSLPKDLGLQARGNAKDILNMHLGHGDIVVMHGAKIQEYYEHAVDPVGKLRFALTCRYIDPESLKEEDRPAYDVGPDTGNYDGSRLHAVAV